MQNTPIRTQADMASFIGGITTDAKNVRWEAFMQAQMRRIEAENQKMFDEMRAPNGEPWAKNAPSTIKAKGHGIILVHHLKLKPAMTKPFAEAAVRMTVDEWPKCTIIFGNLLPYSPMNDRGNPAKNLPARPHIGVSLSFFESMVSPALEYYQKAITK